MAAVVRLAAPLVGRMRVGRPCAQAAHGVLAFDDPELVERRDVPRQEQARSQAVDRVPRPTPCFRRRVFWVSG